MDNQPGGVVIKAYQSNPHEYRQYYIRNRCITLQTNLLVLSLAPLTSRGPQPRAKVFPIPQHRY